MRKLFLWLFVCLPLAVLTADFSLFIQTNNPAHPTWTFAWVTNGIPGELYMIHSAPTLDGPWDTGIARVPTDEPWIVDMRERGLYYRAEWIPPAFPNFIEPNQF